MNAIGREAMQVAPMPTSTVITASLERNIMLKTTHFPVRFAIYHLPHESN